MSPMPATPAIVLAAGRSTRMGEPKAALRLPGGDCFLGRIVRGLTSGGASPVIVVAAPDDRATPESVPHDLRHVVDVIVNPDAERGQLSSLQCGLERAADAEAVVVTLVDVPLVRAELVTALVDAWRSSRVPLVRPTRNGRHGHPILVGQPLIAELRAADPSSSARTIVRRHAGAGVEIQADDESPFIDVDTPEEYRQLLERLQGSQSLPSPPAVGDPPSERTDS